MVLKKVGDSEWGCGVRTTRYVQACSKTRRGDTLTLTDTRGKSEAKSVCWGNYRRIRTPTIVIYRFSIRDLYQYIFLLGIY